MVVRISCVAVFCHELSVILAGYSAVSGGSITGSTVGHEHTLWCAE